MWDGGREAREGEENVKRQISKQILDNAVSSVASRGQC